MQKKDIFLKKGVAVAKAFAYNAHLAEGHTLAGRPNWAFYFGRYCYFSVFRYLTS